MKRVSLTPPPDWQERVQASGCAYPVYPSERGTEEYDWREDAMYVFLPGEIRKLRHATETVVNLLTPAVEAALANPDITERIGLPGPTHALLVHSWRKGERNLAMRLDWSFSTDGTPKLLEIETDVLHGMTLGGPAQRTWLEAVKPEAGQWNELEDGLTYALANLGIKEKMTFSADTDDQARLNEVAFLRLMAERNIRTDFIPQTDIGYNEGRDAFVDLNEREIEALYMMAPLSELIETTFAERWFSDHPPVTRFFEPLWTLLPGSKAFLAWLYNNNPDCPYLLPTFLGDDKDADSLGETYVTKPLWGKEAAGVEIRIDDMVLDSEVDASAENGPEICQQYCPLPVHDGRHVQVSTWVVAGRPAGLVVHEGTRPIVDYYAPVIPHIVEEG